MIPLVVWRVHGSLGRVHSPWASAVRRSTRGVRECTVKKTRFVLPLVLAVAWATPSPAQEKAPLTLVKTIDVAGNRKWDHFGADVKGNRLFVTSEEEPAVEVFDLKTNEHLKSLTDFKEPHNVLPFPEMKKIFVVDGGASEVKILDYDSLKLVGHIPLTID